MERKEIQLLVISLGIVFLTLLVILLVLFFYFLKKKNTYLVEKMESELYFQSELVKTRIEIKDQTLSEISRELHDNIGQILSVAIMQVNRFSNSADKISKTEFLDLKEILSKSLEAEEDFVLQLLREAIIARKRVSFICLFYSPKVKQKPTLC